MKQEETDRIQLLAAGLSPGQLQEQLAIFREGNPDIDIIRPATVADGILRLSRTESDKFDLLYRRQSQTLRPLKFVPASGAASRMFQYLLAYYHNRGGRADDCDPEPVKRFFHGLGQRGFAFNGELEKVLAGSGISISADIPEETRLEILDYLLFSRGLNYSSLPKALIPFHFSEGESRTAIEEHIREGLEIATGSNGQVRLHFTVPDLFRDRFQTATAAILDRIEGAGDRVGVSLSVQDPATQTVTVSENNLPLRDKDGRLIFRPGGHGSLLHNLNRAEGDLIFIKNIDNIAPEPLLSKNSRILRSLAGLLLDRQQQIFKHLKLLNNRGCDSGILEKIGAYMKNSLNIKPPAAYDTKSRQQKQDLLKRILNRPIRVCGMVKNQGKPGGSPFWIGDSDRSESLQIIESSQIRPGNSEQLRQFASATHFNPVLIVCGLNNYRGEKFDLSRYVNPNSYFIAEKSWQGKPIRALEWPGLWNGAMSDWITLFVEVPEHTCTPVKTVNDLLKAEHQGQK